MTPTVKPSCEDCEMCLISDYIVGVGLGFCRAGGVGGRVGRCGLVVVSGDGEGEV